MAAVIRMPEIATGSAEAAIANWLVSVGDDIVEGQEIVEIETEKATVEYSAEQSGIVAGILLAAGTSAEVGTPIIVLATGGQSAAEALTEAGAMAAAPAAASVQEQALGAVEASESNAAEMPPVAAETSAAATTSDRQFASPLVRKLAKERGLDLSSVHGSGPNGRIVRRDLNAVATAQSAAAAHGAKPVATPAEPTTMALPAHAATAIGHQSDAGHTDIPHTGMRRAIARRLTESKSTVPHFYLVADCRVDALLALRSQINDHREQRISVNDFVVKAVAGALQDVPEANAIWTDDATRRFNAVDISIAVSIPGGLLTPVLRDAEKLSIGNLSTTIKDLATRARDGKLKQHELEGGSFSVSNLGMYGTKQFSAILNPPQSGILAVGAAEKRAVVGEDGSLGVATVMTVTLSADHRVLDGALAAEWLAAFQKRIEHPMSILV